MATNDEIKEKYNAFILTYNSPTKEIKLRMMLNEARAAGYKKGYKQLLAKLQKCIYYCHGGYTHIDWKQLKETFPELNLQKG